VVLGDLGEDVLDDFEGEVLDEFEEEELGGFGAEVLDDPGEEVLNDLEEEDRLKMLWLSSWFDEGVRSVWWEGRFERIGVVRGRLEWELGGRGH
jgi:hypothetical protein